MDINIIIILYNILLYQLLDQIDLFFFPFLKKIVRKYFLCYYWAEAVQLSVLVRPLTPVRPGAGGGVCCLTRSVSHGGTAAIGPSRSSSSSAAHHRVPSTPTIPISHLECPIKSGSGSSAGALTSRRLLGHERPGGHPPLFVSAQQSPAPPMSLQDNRRPAPLPRACGGPCLGPPDDWPGRRRAGGAVSDHAERGTPEDERLLSSAGCGCQSWLWLRRKRILTNADEDSGVLRRSGPTEVPLRSHTLIFIRNLSGGVLALAAAAATAAAVLSLPAPSYRQLMTT